MTLTRTQQAQLKRIMEGDGWDILKQEMNRRIRELKDEDVNGQNEFETLRMLHKQQGKVEGLLQFFDDIEKGALS